MKYNKFFNVIVLFLSVFTFTDASVQPCILKVSSSEFVFYSVEKQVKIQLCRVEGGNLTIIDEFIPKFPDNEVIIKGFSPNGKQYLSAKYNLIGKIGDKYYFQVSKMKKIIEYDRVKKSITQRFAPYPKILKRISAAKNSIVLSSDMVMPDRSKNLCSDKYFIKKDHSWVDELCFGVGRNLMFDLDFPDTVIYEGGNLAAIYFSKASELSVYNIDKGELIEKFIVARNHTAFKEKGNKREFLFEVKDHLYLLNFSKGELFVFKLKEKEWQLINKIPGSFQSGILLDKHGIFLIQGGKIEIKKIDI